MKTEDKKQDQQQELIPLVVGEFLQHHRLKKNLTLATVAEAIKLDEKLLSDIEHDEAGHIALVYRKGYIEAYAKYLQIPPDDIPTLFDPDSEKEPSVRNIFAIPPSRNPMDKWLRATSYVLASLLIGTLAWQFTHEAVRLSQGGSQLPRNNSEAQRVNEPVNASIAPLRALHSSQADGMDTAEQAWTAITQPVLSDGQSKLQITVSADSWIEITDADGVELEMDLLRGGSEKSYTGKRPFRILFGRASAIHLSMDDVPVDLTAHTTDDVAQLIWPQESTAENLVADELPVIDQ